MSRRHEAPHNRTWRNAGRMAIAICVFALTNVLSLKPSATQEGRATEAPAIADDGWVLAQRGLASFYARHFHGRRTASGTPFDNERLLAAHPLLPFGTVVRVTNLENGRRVRVEVVDRGPARGPRREGVVIDLSRAAAEELDFIEDGLALVRLEVRPDAIRGSDDRTDAEADPPGDAAPARDEDRRE